ncbi:DedA family protein [Amycolatopsis taiwanensis]|uniref:DedA family protein n=1 Tax=Amycolatopsis taiwanensis TaxID=342230 RepID=UPI0004AF6A73|nr:DedA family protein [Amycolatopsis taiwanensis]
MEQFLLAESAAEPLGGLAGWVVDLMDSLGGPGVALTVGADNLFPPIPSELVLPLAGFSASQGTLSLPGALAWTTAGSVVGAIIVYLLGAMLGRARTRALIAKIPLLKVSDFDRAEAWFTRHGTKAVFLGRMVPLFRSVISLPAGVERMNLPKFLFLTTAGSLIWNTIFVLAGYALGVKWYLVNEYADIFQRIVIVAVAVVVALFVVIRLRNRGRGRGPADPDATQVIDVWSTGRGRSWER